MQSFGQLAAALLEGVTSSVPDEGFRKYVAPGPDFAVDCPLLVVALPSTPVWAQGDGAPCALIPSAQFTVVYAQDCAPGVDDKGHKPTPDALSDFAVAWMDECDAVWAALADFVLANGCDTWQMDTGTFRGPTGRMVSYRIPVTWTALSMPAPDPGP